MQRTLRRPRADDELGPQHEMNWIRAIQGCEKATSPFEMAAPLTMRPGSRL